MLSFVLISLCFCSQQIELASFKLQSGSLEVLITVQNIAYNKKVSVLYGSNAFDCTYQKQINQTYETWIGQIPNYPTLTPFSLRYIVNQNTFLDKGPNGLGYTISSDPAPVTSSKTTRPSSTTMPSPTTSPNPGSLGSSLVLFQTFDWNALTNGRANHFNYINTQVQSYYQAGFDIIWLPPVTQSVDSQGYFPTRWYSLINEQAIRSINQQTGKVGMLSIVDLVVNHRGGVSVDPCTGKYTQFDSPVMGNWAVVASDAECTNQNVFVCPSQCGCGSADTGQNFCAGPDLDHTNDKVRSLVKEFITYLRDQLGFDGMRIDMSKGFAGKYQAEYESHWSPKFAVGEVFDGDLNVVKSFLRDSNFQISAFDFPLYFNLQRSIASNSFGTLNGDNAGVISYNSTLAVTFVGNHDISRKQDFGNNDQILQGYAYILSHPGTPMVYFSHYQNQNIQKGIITLIALRKEIGINANSAYRIDKATNGLYAAYITGTNGEIAVKLGTGDWSPQTKEGPVFTGSNVAVWSLLR